MIFPSYIFLLVFLPIAIIGWYSILSPKVRLYFLTTASYVFYGWWDFRFCALLFATSTADYIFARKIHSARSAISAKRWLIGSLSLNLLSLGIFKYYDFFVRSFYELQRAFGLDLFQPHFISIILPLGISFYTFQSISYTIDVYRKVCNPAPSLIHFLAFVSFFPHLVAGPIVRYVELANQIRDVPTKGADPAGLVEGVWYFTIGISKKVLIADPLAPLVNLLFDNSGIPSTGTAWCGSFAYAFQLYFDFSGYSDMAVGLALLFGFRFPRNFNSPYLAQNISDFWRRWHITLSAFLRDNLYIPLGGSNGSALKTIMNLFIVMFLGGMWHGAAWTYIVWGIYHGVLLGIHSIFRSFKLALRIPALVGISFTFGLVSIGWIIFRAPTLSRASSIIQALFGWQTQVPDIVTLPNLISALEMTFRSQLGITPTIYLIVAALVAFLTPNSHTLVKFFMHKQHGAWAALPAVVLLICLMQLGKSSPFLYFNF